MEVYPGISIDSDVRFGKPCLSGTRIDVATVLGALGAGESFESVQENFRIERGQILAALEYAAHVTAHLPPPVRRVS